MSSMVRRVTELNYAKARNIEAILRDRNKLKGVHQEIEAFKKEERQLLAKLAGLYHAASQMGPTESEPQEEENVVSQKEPARAGGAGDVDTSQQPPATAQSTTAQSTTGALEE